MKVSYSTIYGDVSADGVSRFDSSCYKESFNKTV